MDILRFLSRFRLDEVRRPRPPRDGRSTLDAGAIAWALILQDEGDGDENADEGCRRKGEGDAPVSRRDGDGLNRTASRSGEVARRAKRRGVSQKAMLHLCVSLDDQAASLRPVSLCQFPRRDAQSRAGPSRAREG